MSTSQTKPNEPSVERLVEDVKRELVSGSSRTGSMPGHLDELLAHLNALRSALGVTDPPDPGRFDFGKTTALQRYLDFHVASGRILDDQLLRVYQALRGLASLQKHISQRGSAR